MPQLRDILTPAWLKDRYLYGVVLTQDEGIPYPDGLFETCIDSAIALAEHTFGVVLVGGLRAYSDRIDYSDKDRSAWMRVDLPSRPVRLVTSLGFQFGDFPAARINPSWVHISSDVAGTVQVIPGQSTFAAALQAPFMAWASHEYVPRFYAVEYLAGFDAPAGIRSAAVLGTTDDPAIAGHIKVTPSVAPATGKTFTATFAGTTKATITGDVVNAGEAVTESLTWAAGESRAKTTTADFASVSELVTASTGGTPTFTVESVPTYPVPAEIVDAIGLMASMLPLDTAGDLIAGAGIATYSISIDGISQSIGTTSSATNAGYGAKILSYQKRLKDIVERSERVWRPMGLFSV